MKAIAVFLTVLNLGISTFVIAVRPAFADTGCSIDCDNGKTVDCGCEGDNCGCTTNSAGCVATCATTGCRDQQNCRPI
jgi:hypothetical protein